MTLTLTLALALALTVTLTLTLTLTRCTPAVEAALQEHGVTACSSRLECGETSVHVQLEAAVAKFLDKEDALVVGMGFATNSTLIPVTWTLTLTLTLTPTQP